MKRIASLSFLAAFLSSLIILGLYYRNIPFLEELDGRALDLMFDIRGERTPDPRIAIVAVDEKSLKELGRWPWSRKVWAGFIRKTSEFNPGVLIFDVWFSERESGEADRALQKAILHSGKVVLPFVFEFDDPTSHADISEWALRKDAVSGRGSAFEGKGVIASLPAFSHAAAGSGHINISPDGDGTIRWTPLLVRYDGSYYPSLALAAAKKILKARSISASAGEETRIGGAKMPTDEAERLLINYNGREKTYPYYSFSDVLLGRVDARLLKDRILFVGVSAQGLYDMRVTPLSSNMPGVEVNANILDNMLNRNFLARGPLQRLIEILFILLPGILFGLLLPRVRAVFAFPFALTVMIGYGALCFYFFLEGQWTGAFYPAMSMGLSYLSATAVGLFKGERRVKEIKRIFSSYVSKKIVDEIIRHPEKAELGGHLKEVTILFCDLKGFTSYNERHSPHEVVIILNEFFEVMTDCIMKYDGTLDKFLGDGVMAFWNAPLDQEDHPELAIRCALDMEKRFGELRERWKLESRELLEYGAGLNIAEVIIGNIGVAGRKMEYTAIGDGVNTTYRIIDHTRTFNRNIMVTEDLFERVRDLVSGQDMGPVRMKGKEEPVRLYAITGLRGPR